MEKRFFSISPIVNSDIPVEADRVGAAVAWLIKNRGKDGTWGGPDNLDRFTCTNHAVMALLCVGVSPDATLIRPAVSFLKNIDSEQNLHFFYRSSVFCNLPGHDDVVRHDAEFIWKYKRRLAVHRDYPVLFFLLKLVRFCQADLGLSFAAEDVLTEILGDFDLGECWYGKPSITSMALALVHDLDFPKGSRIERERVVFRCIEFLCEQFAMHGRSGRFSANLVDDLYVVFNLCESDLLLHDRASALRSCVEETVSRVCAMLGALPFIDESAPFGGNIDHRIYPTAVAIRSLMSFLVMSSPDQANIVGPALLNAVVTQEETRPSARRAPIWGTIDQAQIRQCFMLMPFDKKLTQIYARYIKRPLERRCKLKCVRADNIFKPGPIMADVWQQICVSDLVIAEMTHRNANVFYELGLAHALGKEVILISQSLEDVPFDLRSLRVIIYEDSPEGYEGLRQQIIQVAQELVPVAADA